MDHVVRDQKQYNLAPAQVSILNSHILSNRVVSNSQSLRDTETLSLMSEQREVHMCVAQQEMWLCGLESTHVTLSVLLKHIFGS